MDYTFERPIIQGDVILKRLKTLPESAVRVEMEKRAKSLVLQHSEVTGHHHHFKPTAAVELYRLPLEYEGDTAVNTITPNERKLIVVREEEQLFHGKGFDITPALRGTGDHQALSVPPGIYEVDITREYDYDRMEERLVVD